MAKIQTISPADASGELAEAYESVGAKSGSVANILAVQSLSPRTLETHYAFYREIMFGRGALSRSQRELIAVAVSQANKCEY